jgi:hypothetical protein
MHAISLINITSELGCLAPQLAESVPGEVDEDAPVAFFVGVGQGAASDTPVQFGPQQIYPLTGFYSFKTLFLFCFPIKTV